VTYFDGEMDLAAAARLTDDQLLEWLSARNLVEIPTVLGDLDDIERVERLREGAIRAALSDMADAFSDFLKEASPEMPSGGQDEIATGQATLAREPDAAALTGGEQADADADADRHWRYVVSTLREMTQPQIVAEVNQLTHVDPEAPQILIAMAERLGQKDIADLVTIYDQYKRHFTNPAVPPEVIWKQLRKYQIFSRDRLNVPMHEIREAPDFDLDPASPADPARAWNATVGRVLGLRKPKDQDLTLDGVLVRVHTLDPDYPSVVPELSAAARRYGRKDLVDLLARYDAYRKNLRGLAADAAILREALGRDWPDSDSSSSDDGDSSADDDSSPAGDPLPDDGLPPGAVLDTVVDVARIWETVERRST